MVVTVCHAMGDSEGDTSMDCGAGQREVAYSYKSESDHIEIRTSTFNRFTNYPNSYPSSELTPSVFL